MLILTQFIAKHELQALSKHITLDDVLVGARKALKGLAIETKPPRPLAGFRFFKVRIGEGNSARMIVFVVTENKKVVPLLIRLKKDKVLGMNMAMNNPEVIRQMNKNLDQVLQDIKTNRYQEFTIQ